mmetsp:Transcript_99136/g.285093  ORF Transcript_99136/g.285093 Transcript_99136/m.285093 type:complete len:334 (-) Transcript_99136:1217-2218(-)
MSSKKRACDISEAPVPTMCSKSFSACPSTNSTSLKPLSSATNLSLLNDSPSAKLLKYSSPLLPSSPIFVRIAVTLALRFRSISAYAFRTARSLAISTRARIFSARAWERECRPLSRGTKLWSYPFKSSFAPHSPSIFLLFSETWSSNAWAPSMSFSMVDASSLRPSAPNSSGPTVAKGHASASARPSVDSASLRSSPASAAIFDTAARCSSKSNRRLSSSARSVRARTSERAMATFWKSDRNFLNSTGSNVRMILSRVLDGSSKSNSVLLKATTSARLNVPSLSPSCLSKAPRRSFSFAKDAALRSAFCLAQSAALLRVSITSRPSTTTRIMS